MKREMSVGWSTDYNEEDNQEPIITNITLTNDDEGNNWLYLDLDRGRNFKRLIHHSEMLKLSRFFYDAADFIKRDS